MNIKVGKSGLDQPTGQLFSITWELLPDDLSALEWREEKLGESCKFLESSKAMTIGQLVSAYNEKKRYFFETYSVF